MRSLESSVGSQLPFSVPEPGVRTNARPRPPSPAPVTLRYPLPIFWPHSLWEPPAPTSRQRSPRQRTQQATCKEEKKASHTGCSLLTQEFPASLFIHSTLTKCSSQWERGCRRPGGVGARGVGKGVEAARAGREQGQAAGWAGGRLGRRAGPRSRARAAGRTGPGRQCAFVYVARAAAANMHLKSPRVSARQPPAAQSARRRAPRTAGPRSLWYISDLTSRAGPILRWELFRVHLGSLLDFFFSERGVTSQVLTARSAAPVLRPPDPTSPRALAATPPFTRGEGAKKAGAKGNASVGR